MDKQPQLDVVSGAEALEQVRRFPTPAETGILHIPEQDITWPMLVPTGGLSLQLDPDSEQQLTYGIATGIVAFDETFHLLGRVDYAYGDQEETALFRLDYRDDQAMLESIAELGIVALSSQIPPKYAKREELVAYLTEVPTFVCQLDEMEAHRIRVQLIRVEAQKNL
ncbi:MAG TPA: hypothetical protein VFV52_06685 [Bacilli bacterium]|nr:hypothetical protein [Bacilli bacterium]